MSRKRYRYTGKEKDDETGLYYHGARFLAPWLGRWTAADPIGISDGANRFAYVHGNPIRGRDPTGMAELVDLEQYARAGGNWYDLLDAARNMPEAGLWERVTKVAALGGAKLGVAVEDFSAMGHNPDVVVQQVWQATPLAAAIEGARAELAKGGSTEEILHAADRASDEQVDALMVGALALTGETGLGVFMLGPNASRLAHQVVWGEPDPLTRLDGGDTGLEARVDDALGSMSDAALVGGMLVPAAGAAPTRLVDTSKFELRFSQTTASSAFNVEGLFAGETVGSLAAQLRAGTISPAHVPVRYVNIGGNKLIVDTRSSLSLMRAGVPRRSWSLVDATATELAEIEKRLITNELTAEGTDVLRITGAGQHANSLK